MVMPARAISKISKVIHTAEPARREKLTVIHAVGDRNALIAKILGSSLLTQYLDNPKIKIQADTRKWEKIITEVMNLESPIVNEAIGEIDALSVEEIISQANAIVGELSKRFQKDSLGIEEFFRVETHGQVDPAQILTESWGNAYSIIDSIDHLSQRLQESFSKCIKKGYLFLRAAELTSERVERDETAKLKRENLQLLEELAKARIELARHEALKLQVHKERGELNSELEKLEEESNFDGLTTLLNRRSLEKELCKEISCSKRKGKKLSILFLDLDHFKDINDTYGHQIGDEVLKELAQVFKNNGRKEDIIARYGGEEFVMLLRETDVLSASKIAERTRKLTERNVIKNVQGLFRPVTISIGIAELKEGDDENSLKGRADEALYKAKGKDDPSGNGRNRTVVATEEGFKVTTIADDGKIILERIPSQSMPL